MGIKLNPILEKIKYPMRTIEGDKYYVSIDTLKKEIKKAKEEAQKNEIY